MLTTDDDIHERGPDTLLAADIVRQVETRVTRREKEFGHRELLWAIDHIDPAVVDEHTDFYRRIIRANRWPNTMLPDMNTRDFIDGFGRCALAFVDVGFIALRYLSAPSGNQFPSVYRTVLASEALRGQFGKSSPDGLDARLDRLEERLLQELRDEALLVLLCTPYGGLLSAETSLIEDFVDVKQQVEIVPDIEGMVQLAPPASTVVWRFLRRHSRWSIRIMARCFKQLPACVGRLAEIRRERETRATERKYALNDLSPVVRNIVDSIVALNYLNLTLEPYFGFKGCVGVPHGVVFREAAHIGLSVQPNIANISSEKWNLYNHLDTGSI